MERKDRTENQASLRKLFLNPAHLAGQDNLGWMVNQVHSAIYLINYLSDTHSTSQNLTCVYTTSPQVLVNLDLPVKKVNREALFPPQVHFIWFASFKYVSLIDENKKITYKCNSTETFFAGPPGPPGPIGPKGSQGRFNNQ